MATKTAPTTKVPPHPPQPPPVTTTTPSALLSTAQQSVARTRALHAALTANVDPSTAAAASILQLLAEAENGLITDARLLEFYGVVSPDDAVRDASEEARALFAAFKIETAMNETLFSLVDTALQQGADEIDGETRRWLEKVRREHVANGLSLPPGPVRDRFKEIKSRIGELEGEFLENFKQARSGTGGVWFNRAELNGVDEDALNRLALGEGENNGLLKVGFGSSDYLAILRSATTADTRKRMFVEADNAMGASVPLFKEAIVLRDEAARLLGYPSHAAFSTSDKMAQNPEAVGKFLMQLQNGLGDAVEEEIHRLKDLKREDVESRGETFDGRYFIWDHLYYHTLSLKRDHAVDQQSVLEYFSSDSVVTGMLGIFEEIMGLHFVELDKTANVVWHEDVQFYGVWNAEDLGGEFLGYLYLDLYPREGKSNNPRSSNLVPGIPGQVPSTALLCSFPRSDKNNPGLLQHNEIVLLFHELGHCIHDLVCSTTYARLHGPEGTALDFSEAPSQLLEYWFWTPSVLKAIARHYSYLTPEYFESWKGKGSGAAQPPERLPDETVQKLVATKHVNAAVPNLRQLAISIFDMEVHSARSQEELAMLDVSETYNKLRREMSRLEDLSDLGQGHGWGHGWAMYSHLMDGYDAGFYSYLYSKVYAADIFQAKFASDPMNAAEGRKFRNAVLAKGGVQDEMEMMTEYLGREPNMEAFCPELGIV